MSRVVGLDPSLTGFGVAVCDGGRVANAVRLDTGRRSGHERAERLIELVSGWTRDAVLVVIEGPSYRSGSQAQTGHHERAGLWWAVTQELWRDGCPYAVVAPATRAVYATGSGLADKAAVMAAVSERWGLGEIRDDNVADAMVLAAMGARHVGEPLPDGGHLRALTAVRWPALHLPAVGP